MTEFLHEKYKEFIRNNYGIQSGGFMCSNIEELMCDFATEVAKEYIEMANKLKEENELIKNSDSLCKLIGKQKLKIKELEKQIIEWHEPNDFPKRNGNVVQNQDGDKVTYDYRLKYWRWTDGGTDGLKMIAWCEIPKLGGKSC